jgi:heme-degrading monooxygenase HmoA
MSRIAHTPPPPYYAVIFTSLRAPVEEGYAGMAERMEQLAMEQPGYLGHENFRDADGYGTTISYWAGPEDIRRWKANLDHLVAQRLGREQWYERYKVRVCRVEREYEFSRI